MNIKELLREKENHLIRLREIRDLVKSENREMTDAEKTEVREISSKIQYIDLSVTCENAPVNFASREAEKATKLVNIFREAKNGGEKEFVLGREVTTGTSGVDANFPLTVKDIVPALDEYGLIYDQLGIPVETGQHGNYNWPFLDNFKASWEDEGAQVSQTTPNFKKLSPSPKRLSCSVTITNQLIMMGGEKLKAAIIEKVRRAVNFKLNEHIFNTDPALAAVGSVNYGPFAKIATGTAATLASLDTKAKKKACRYLKFAGSLPTYKELLALKSLVAIHGVRNAKFAYVMDEFTKAELEATPIDAGSGIMIVRDGKIAGYPIYCTNEINRGGMNFVAFGAFDYLPCGQFGDVRFIIDPYTLADKDEIKITINADWAINYLYIEAFALGTHDTEPSGSGSESSSSTAGA